MDIVCRGTVVKSGVVTKVHCYSNSQTGVLSYRMWSLVQQLPPQVRPIIDDYVMPPGAPRLQVHMRSADDDTMPDQAGQEAALDQDKGRADSPVAGGSGGKPRSAGSRPHSAASSSGVSGSDTLLGIKANGTYFRVPTAFALQLVQGQELPLQLQVGGSRGHLVWVDVAGWVFAQETWAAGVGPGCCAAGAAGAALCMHDKQHCAKPIQPPSTSTSQPPSAVGCAAGPVAVAGAGPGGHLLRPHAYHCANQPPCCSHSTPLPTLPAGGRGARRRGGPPGRASTPQQLPVWH